MEVKPDIETFAKIKVIGVGGSGTSAISRMKDQIRGVEFLAINTDAQALHHSTINHKIHIGQNTTKGLGAGMDPELGRRAAEEDQEAIREAIKGADMVFITCGLGGGTGTGASPVVAEAAKEAGALTVAIVTKPFYFEGAQRKAIAEMGLRELGDQVDTIIVIPNDRLLQIIDKKTTLLESFAVVDDVLRQAVQGIAEIITVPGLINVDFADVKSIMKDAGTALMGIGKASGENRAQAAAKIAVGSPLLDLSIDGAKGILFTVAGGADLTMNEINEAAEVITSSADQGAKIIFGAVVDEGMGDEVKITVIATGFEGKAGQLPFKEEGRTATSPGLRGKEARAGGTSKLGKSYTQTGTSAPIPWKPTLPPTKTDFKEKKTKTGLPTKAESASSEDDLEIPAFIRKKMK